MNDLGRGIVYDRSFPLLPPLLARKWSSWRAAEESPVLGEFLGWENSAPMSGQTWCLFTRRGLGPEHLAGLLPVPTSVPGAGLGGRISDKASWEAGSQRGMELPSCRARPDLQLQHGQPGSAAALGRFLCRELARCCSYRHFAGCRESLGSPANPGCERCGFPPREACLPSGLFWDVQDLLVGAV